MDIKKIAMILFVSSLLIGGVCATKNVGDFSVDNNYKNQHTGQYCAVYMNNNKDAGLTIYKNVDDDLYDDEIDDQYDDLIHDDGYEYLHVDDDMGLDKHADNTAAFKDYDNAEHGVVEVVKSNGQDYTVVLWAKDSNNMKNADLMKQMEKFNKDNKVEAVAF